MGADSRAVELEGKETARERHPASGFDLLRRFPQLRRRWDLYSGVERGCVGPCSPKLGPPVVQSIPLPHATAMDASCVPGAELGSTVCISPTVRNDPIPQTRKRRLTEAKL